MPCRSHLDLHFVSWQFLIALHAFEMCVFKDRYLKHREGGTSQTQSSESVCFLCVSSFCSMAPRFRAQVLGFNYKKIYPFLNKTNIPSHFQNLKLPPIPSNPYTILLESCKLYVFLNDTKLWVDPYSSHGESDCERDLWCSKNLIYLVFSL